MDNDSLTIRSSSVWSAFNQTTLNFASGWWLNSNFQLFTVSLKWKVFQNNKTWTGLVASPPHLHLDQCKLLSKRFSNLFRFSHSEKFETWISLFNILKMHSSILSNWKHHQSRSIPPWRFLTWLYWSSHHRSMSAFNASLKLGSLAGQHFFLCFY